MVKKNCCVFISGNGTNLNALIKNSRSYIFPINIKLIISNRKNARGLDLAKKFSIPYKIINMKKNLFENELMKEILYRKISIICLAGFMKILSDKFIKNFNGKILNIHPSLLPKYKGLNTFEKIIKNKETLTGCTVHYVNKNLDGGKILLKKSFEIFKKDDINKLKSKTQKLEHQAFSEAIINLYRMN